jgi:hypothetical protein
MQKVVICKFRQVNVIVLALFLIALIGFFTIPISSSFADSLPSATYDNATIADIAYSYWNHSNDPVIAAFGGTACDNARKLKGQYVSDSDGQCRSFVNCIVYLASNGIQNVSGGPNYFSNFLARGGQEIFNSADLRKGDIVQRYYSDSDLHTVIIYDRKSDGTFWVVDSNNDFHVKVQYHPYPFALDRVHVRAFRMGYQVTSLRALSINNVIKVAGSVVSYFYDGSLGKPGTLRWIPDGETFFCLTNRDHRQVIEFPQQSMIDVLGSGKPWVARCVDPARAKGHIVQDGSGGGSWLYDGKTLHRIPYPSIYDCLINRGLKVLNLDNVQQVRSLGDYGSTATCLPFPIPSPQTGNQSNESGQLQSVIREYQDAELLPILEGILPIPDGLQPLKYLTEIPPPTPASVGMSQGAAAQYGYWYVVTLNNFTPNLTISVGCYDSQDQGAWHSFNVTVDGNGNASSTGHCYSAMGPSYWVVANGIESNHVQW